MIARLVLLSSLLAAGAARAGDFQPLEDIRAAAVGAAVPGAAADADATATLDPELKLPRCGEPLQAHVGARSVAEVACPGPSAWRLYVPVRVTRTQPVLVLVRTIGAGQTVTADALASQSRNVAALQGGLVYDASRAVGRVAARTLVAGNPLLETDLIAPRAVRRGEAVMLVARGSGVEVHAPGKALGDAGLDERVNVENLNSRRVVQGFVRAGGEIEVAQ